MRVPLSLSSRVSGLLQLLHKTYLQVGSNERLKVFYFAAKHALS